MVNVIDLIKMSFQAPPSVFSTEWMKWTILQTTRKSSKHSKLFNKNVKFIISFEALTHYGPLWHKKNTSLLRTHTIEV